ncbi:MAG: hypothetical protein ACYDAC_01045 [Candidatus Dormibacteria bacterium]
MQRGVTPPSDGGGGGCGRCGGSLFRSHREYAGGGASRDVLRCRDCGATSTSAPTADADRRRAASPGRSRRHRPVVEGPPPNPVLDAATARRLLDALTPPE